MTRAKDEALRALAHLRTLLDSAEPLTGLRAHQVRATLDYATEQVQAIQEVKRVRKASPPEAV